MKMPTETSTPSARTAAALLALLVLLCITVMAATQVAGTERLPPPYDPAGSPLGIGRKVRAEGKKGERVVHFCVLSLSFLLRHLGSDSDV